MKRWLQKFMGAQTPEVAKAVLGVEPAVASTGSGTSDHSLLSNLTADDHTQYALADGSRGTFEVSGSVAAHEAAGDPHPAYALESALGTAAAADIGVAPGEVAAADDARLSDDRVAAGIRTATTIVLVNSATAPSSGQVLTATSSTAADWQTPSSSALWTAITKGADQTKNSNTTFAADDALTLAVTAQRYLFRAVVFFDSAANPDIKFRWTGPSTSMQSLHIRAVVGGATAYANISVDKALSTTDSLAGTGASGVYLMDGIVQFSANGTFALEWAQNTSDAANTTVLRGSYLEYRAI